MAGTSSPPPGELGGLGAEIVTLDMTDFEAVTAFGLERPLDLLIANAGVARPGEAKTASDGAGWLELLAINTVAPTLLAQTLLPQLAEAKGKAVAISSQMGSIDDASTGWIPYRSSKAALNMAWHVLANEVRAGGDDGDPSPRLGPDRYGRPQRDDRCAGQRHRDARGDRGVDARTVWRILHLRGARTAVVACLSLLL